MKISSLIALVALLLCFSSLADAQDTTCNSGDVLWVSSTLNADVGTATGTANCSATTAGAFYNDINNPFGIQGAMDCVCPGVEVRLLGDTGNFGSSTGSWNNRVDATKKVLIREGIGTNSPAGIIGYADSSTSCENSNAPAGCPVEVNFTSGSGDGFEIANTGYFMAGLDIVGALDHCVSGSGFGVWNIFGVVIRDCGAWGINVTPFSGRATITRVLVRDTGSVTAGTGGIFIQEAGLTPPQVRINWSTVLDVTGTGIRLDEEQVDVRHTIIQNASGDCFTVNADGAWLRYSTIRTCGDDGIDTLTSTPALGIGRLTVTNSIIFGATGWGINRIGHATGRPGGAFVNNKLGSNTLGAINTTNTPQSRWTWYSHNDLSATIGFATSTNSTPTDPGAKINFTYGSGNTTIEINAGAVP